jgi:hypothetical protein
VTGKLDSGVSIVVAMSALIIGRFVLVSLLLSGRISLLRYLAENVGPYLEVRYIRDSTRRSIFADKDEEK